MAPLQSAGPRRKPGPVGKGNRTQHTVRFPDEQYSVYAEAADKAGLDLGDYVALCMAQAHTLAVPEYIRRATDRHSGQEELQLTG